MRESLLDLPQSCEDIQALRRIIAHFAGRCRIDLADSTVFRGLLDGDFRAAKVPTADRQKAQELSAMLTLLLRLEASSSEDLGIAGLHRLWHEHGKILARCRAGRNHPVTVG